MYVPIVSTNSRFHETISVSPNVLNIIRVTDLSGHSEPSIVCKVHCPYFSIWQLKLCSSHIGTKRFGVSANSSMYWLSFGNSLSIIFVKVNSTLVVRYKISCSLNASWTVGLHILKLKYSVKFSMTQRVIQVIIKVNLTKESLNKHRHSNVLTPILTGLCQLYKFILFVYYIYIYIFKNLIWFCFSHYWIQWQLIVLWYLQ